jgi:hypothetical protein
MGKKYTTDSINIGDHNLDASMMASLNTVVSNHGSYITSNDVFSGNYNDLTNKPTIPSLSGYATQSYVTTQINNLVASAPGSLNTLNELAAALGDDANFSTTVTNSIAAKLPKTGGTMTGALTISGSTSRGTYTSASNYHTGADNIVLKGNSSGISGIFFESEKNGTNINHPTDFGFIQYHSHGTSTGGEANELIIGVSNDSDDHVILNAPNAEGFKVRVATSEYDYKIYHDAYHPNADKWTIARTLSLTGDVTGSVNWDGSGNASITATVQDDSHNHAISNIDYLQSALDNKASASHNHDDRYYTETEVNSLLAGKQASGTYNTIIGTDSDLNTAGSTIIDNIYVTDGVITSMGTRTLTASDIGAAALYHGHSQYLTTTGKAADSNLLDGIDSSGFFIKSGSWLGDLGSNGYTRESGLSMTGGSEFVILSKAGQGTLLVDGAYIAYESNNGFFGSYNSSYGNASGIRATGANTVSVMQLDGGNANLIVTGELDASLPWNSITSKPSTFAPSSHNHDDRYYTETESDARFLNVAGDTMTGSLRAQADLNYFGLNNLNNEAEVIINTANAGSPQIGFTENGDASWAIGVDDGDNSFKIHGGANSTIPTINNLVTPIFELTTSGLGYFGTQRIFAENYHPNADKWTTARTLSLSGDASGSVSWDGSANATLSVAVNNDSHYHSQIYIPDTRGASRAPSYYPYRYTSFDFQNNSDTGAGGDSWHVLQTVVPWSSYNSTHRQQQIAFTGTGGLKFRYATSSSAWASWQTLWTSGNDGSGSGLDADKLDGQHGSYYYPASNPNGYTSNTGDITGITAGGGLTGGGTSGTVTLSHTNTSSQSSVNNSSGTVIQDITLDTYGHITGLASYNLDGRYYTKSASDSRYYLDSNPDGYTSNIGDITAVTAGTNLNGGGTSGAVTLNLNSNINLNEVNIGQGIELKESSDRADLLQITSATSSWAGIQIRNSADDGRWSFMTDGATGGFYDDQNNDWAVQMIENGAVGLRHNGIEKFVTTSAGVQVYGNLTVSSNVYASNFILQSDKRLKTKITDLPCNNIDVNWKSFEIKEEEGDYRTGVIAQELEETHPEFVNTDSNGFKSVKYIDLLIAKIAELEARLDKLEK